MKNRGVALIISGPSGVGKGTLLKMLMKEFPEINFSISYTTRKPRPGEIDGVDYVFVTKGRFFELVKEGMFAEWAEVHGNYYGTPKQEIENKLNKGIDVVFDIDVQGAVQLKQNLEDGVFVFILPPSLEELEKRLKKRRTDNEETIKIRLDNSKKEIKKYVEFDYVIVNDYLDDAYDKLRCIYLATKVRVRK